MQFVYNFFKRNTLVALVKKLMLCILLFPQVSYRSKAYKKNMPKKKKKNLYQHFFLFHVKHQTVCYQKVSEFYLPMNYLIA